LEEDGTRDSGAAAAVAGGGGGGGGDDDEAGFLPIIVVDDIAVMVVVPNRFITLRVGVYTNKARKNRAHNMMTSTAARV
jgi:hypothetical protein